MLTAILVLAATCQHMPATAPPRADAVFVEMHVSRPWKTVFENNSGREFVLKHIRGYDDEKCAAGCDNFENIVAAMEAAPDAKIYVGLAHDETFHSPDANSAWAHAAAGEDLCLANALLERLKQKGVTRKVTGWYLAREIYNFNDPHAEKAIHAYYERMSKHLPPGDVIIAPFFLPKTTSCTSVHDADGTAKMFTRLIKDTRITRVVLQDGFAARNTHEVCPGPWSKEAYAVEAAKYECAMAKKGQSWVIVEAFAPEPNRLKLQFATLPKDAKAAIYEYDACVDEKLCH